MNVGDLIIRIGADTRGVREGVEEARVEIESLPDEHVIRIRVEEDGGGGGGNNRNGILNFSRRNKNLLQVLISLLPIVAAGAKVTAGALGGMVSMLGAATVGVSGFGAVAVAALNDVFEAQKNITKANEDMRNASTEAERATAMKNLANAYKGLTGYQLAALDAMQRFKGFWDSFAGSFQKPVVVLFAQALDGLRYLLTNIEPAIRATANALLVMFRNMKELTRTNDFKEFFAWIGGGAGSAVSTFGAMFVNIMHGIMNVMVAFAPISNSMQGGLRGMTEAFVRWSQSIKTSDRFKEFVSFFLAAGPTFLTFFQQFAVLVNDLVHAFAPLGMVMLRIINVILALINYMTAFVLSMKNAASRARDLGNAIRTLFGFQKKAANESQDAIIDVDQAYKDMFGSIGDVTGGIKDAQKAAEGFLASFDEVHNIPDFGGDSGGGFTPPTAPTGGGTGGGSVIPPIVDEEEVQTSKGWLQSLIDKMKEITAFFPFKLDFDPPDWGAGLGAVIDGVVKSAQAAGNSLVVAYQATSTAVQTAWHEMLDYMQAQLNAYNPFLQYGWSLLMLSLVGVVPTAETVRVAWHEMLDYMQSQLNAYRPYIEYGFTLLAAGLSGLAAAALTSAVNWERAWQAIGNAVSAATSPILDNINSVKSAYASLMAMMKQPIEIPSIQLPPMPKIEMPSIVTNIQDTLKNFDYGEWFKGAVKDLGEAALDIGLGATGLKGAQAAGKAAEVGWPAVKAWLENIMGGGGKAITGFANGGIIGNDSIVRVGEAGRQEAIIPLGGKAMQPFANAIASSMGGGGGNAGGGQDIVLQIDGVEFARLTSQYNIKESQRIGGSMITIT